MIFYSKPFSTSCMNSKHGTVNEEVHVNNSLFLKIYYSLIEEMTRLPSKFKLASLLPSKSLVF